MKKEYQLHIDKESSGNRLDVSIIKKVPNLTRSALKSSCTSILVNGKKEKFSYKCREGDGIIFEVEWHDYDNIMPENIPLDIIYEDDNYIVINKKYNMVVHPSNTNFTGTLVNALLGMKKKLADNIDDFRPGIVHRLDKETSGLIIVAKNNYSRDYLFELFKKRQITKKYHAIVKGFFTPSKLKIENNIGRHPKFRKKMAVLHEVGKKSITFIVKVERINNYSYLDIKLETGRTHQIRVHLSHYGFPILGDLIYSRRDKKFLGTPLCLVSYRLSFKDKFSNKTLDFKIDDPKHMKDVIEKLNFKN
ncbi:MAG: RluA family pseudouridine synthase [Spirochaetes bacterium]|nr:RluA family pseudouridine synthase [Spirochaetota bacterium]